MDAAYARFSSQLRHLVSEAYGLAAAQGLTICELAHTLGLAEDSVRARLEQPNGLTPRELSDLLVAMGREPADLLHQHIPQDQLPL